VDSSAFGSLAWDSLIHESSTEVASYNGKQRSLINPTTRAKIVVLWLPLGSWIAAAQKVRGLLADGFTNDKLNLVNLIIQNSTALAEGFK
jgi:hypothetical protein